MRVLADSHAIVWRLQGSDKLSALALMAFDEAEATDGVVVSVATLIDLWYVAPRTGSAAAHPGLARFVPPPAQEVIPAIAALERVIHDGPQATPILIKAALAHAHVERDDGLPADGAQQR